METLIQKRIKDLQNSQIDLGEKKTEEIPAGYGGKMQEFENLNIYSHTVMGDKACEVWGAIKIKYINLGGHGKHPTTGQRLFGFPLFSPQYSIEAGIPKSTFEFGCIYSNHGTVYLSGKIFEYYRSLEYDRSWLGLPIADPRIIENYEIQYFEFGGLCLDLGNSKKIIELRWTTPQLGHPSIIKNTELGLLNMLTVTSSETPVNKETAKTLMDSFRNKLFLKETGGTVEIPLELDSNTIKTYAIEAPPGPNQDVHKSPFKITNIAMLSGIAMKDNTLYDIIIKLPNNISYTLAPHSIYIKNDWATCKFAHITDLHVARRYDNFRKILASKELPNGEKEFANGIKRFNNFNDALRQFIRYANALHEQGKLDFIISTGDLVDYIFEDFDAKVPLDFEDRGSTKLFTNVTNNFKFFEEILRGIAPAPDQQSAAELKVPIFTALGNHDYRVESYYMISDVEVDWFPDYTKNQFGSQNLIHAEANLFKKSVSTERALAMVAPDENNKQHRLNYYFKHINRKRTYDVSIGNNKLIMIDGKWDSAVVRGKADAVRIYTHVDASDELLQFATGTPNSVGFTESEIELVKKALATTSGSVIIGVHNPLINPINNQYPHIFRESLRINASKPFELEMKRHLKRHLPHPQQGVLDTYMFADLPKGWSLTNSAYFAAGDGDNLLDFGIMRGNKLEFLKVCAGVGVPKPVHLVLSGHIHANWECRVKFNAEKNEFYFYSDFYTENPPKYYCEVAIDMEHDHFTANRSETKYEVEIGAFTELVDVDAKITKRADGSYVMKTIPNTDSLNFLGNKAQWWQQHAPLLIQTEPLGPMNSQRGTGPFDPDFRGCRLVSIKDTVITNIDYITKAEISQAVN